MTDPTRKPSFHSRMMNVPEVRHGSEKWADPLTAYAFGHRDARHACAEIANEADAEIADLHLQLQQRGRLISERWALIRESDGQVATYASGELTFGSRDELEREVVDLKDFMHWDYITTCNGGPLRIAKVATIELPDTKEAGAEK